MLGGCRVKAAVQCVGGALPPTPAVTETGRTTRATSTLAIASGALFEFLPPFAGLAAAGPSPSHSWCRQGRSLATAGPGSCGFEGRVGIPKRVPVSPAAAPRLRPAAGLTCSPSLNSGTAAPVSQDGMLRRWQLCGHVATVRLQRADSGACYLAEKPSQL